MKRILLALALTLVVFAPSVTARRSLPATDSLIRDASTLGSNWTAVTGAITDWVLTGSTPPLGAKSAYNGADFASDYWNADSFNADQYSESAISRGLNGYQCVGARFSGTSGYFACLDTCHIYKFTSGARSTIHTCSVSWTNDHILRLTATNTGTVTLRLDDCGTDATCASPSNIDIQTDSSSPLNSGSPGIAGYQDSTGPNMFNWQGDNVGGSGATFPAAIINAPVRGGGHRMVAR